MNRLLLTLPLLLVQGFLTVTLAQPHRVIFDTDFALPPQDDALALLLALNSPEIEVLGITTVAGNKSREQATADALKVLEGVELLRNAGLSRCKHATYPRSFGVLLQATWRVVEGRTPRSPSWRIRQNKT